MYFQYIVELIRTNTNHSLHHIVDNTAI